MTLPSEGLVEPLDGARAEGDERGVAAGSSLPASPRSVSSAPCGLEDHHAGASRLGPNASPQRMEWKVSGVMGHLQCQESSARLYPFFVFLQRAAFEG